jgi:hypothetical protein
MIRNNAHAVHSTSPVQLWKYSHYGSPVILAFTRIGTLGLNDSRIWEGGRETALKEQYGGSSFEVRLLIDIPQRPSILSTRPQHDGIRKRFRPVGLPAPVLRRVCWTLREFPKFTSQEHLSVSLP